MTQRLSRLRQRVFSLSGRQQAVLSLMILAAVGALVLRATTDGSTPSSSGAVRSFSRPVRGQVVMVSLHHLPTCARTGGFAVARVVGLPGELVGVHAGRILVDGHAIHLLPYFVAEGHEAKAPKADFPAQRIPKGQYLALGEAVNPACDSRYFGPFPEYLLRPLAVPRLARAPAFAQGFQTCATFGIAELEALYDANSASAVASAVGREQPSPHKDAIYRGCLAGLPKHRTGAVIVKTPPFVETD
jgi:signal peptidase I